MVLRPVQLTEERRQSGGGQGEGRCSQEGGVGAFHPSRKAGDFRRFCKVRLCRQGRKQELKVAGRSRIEVARRSHHRSNSISETRVTDAAESSFVDRRPGACFWRLVMAQSLCGALLSTGCASYATVPQEDRADLVRELTSKRRDKFLRLSFYVTPFFGDPSKKLLATAPPEEVRLLKQASGEPINPGPVETILPAGTRVQITKVEFPTAAVLPERPLNTPRALPWIYLRAGSRDGQPLILVLRADIRSREEFAAELERYLSDADLAPLLSTWSDVVQLAVRTKTAIIDMSGEALEMAWGYPDRKQISFADSERNEEWIYGERRRAFLTDGRVVRRETGKDEP
jgi:hypothetical protein